jgi:hypothetical protein
VLSVSTRKVEELVEAMGAKGMSKSEVSRMAAVLDQQVKAFQDRRLDSRYQYLWLDALYVKVLEDGRTVSEAVQGGQLGDPQRPRGAGGQGGARRAYPSPPRPGGAGSVIRLWRALDSAVRWGGGTWAGWLVRRGEVRPTRSRWRVRMGEVRPTRAGWRVRRSGGAPNPRGMACPQVWGCAQPARDGVSAGVVYAQPAWDGASAGQRVRPTRLGQDHERGGATGDLGMQRGEGTGEPAGPEAQDPATGRWNAGSGPQGEVPARWTDTPKVCRRPVSSGEWPSSD